MKRTTKIFVLVLIMAAVCAPLSPAQGYGFPPCVPFVNWACIRWDYTRSLEGFQICAVATSSFDVGAVVAGLQVEGLASAAPGGLDVFAIPMFDAPTTAGDSPLHFCTRPWDLTGTTGQIEVTAQAFAAIGGDLQLTVPGGHVTSGCVAWSNGGEPRHCILS